MSPKPGPLRFDKREPCASCPYRCAAGAVERRRVRAAPADGAGADRHPLRLPRVQQAPGSGAGLHRLAHQPARAQHPVDCAAHEAHDEPRGPRMHRGRTEPRAALRIGGRHVRSERSRMVKITYPQRKALENMAAGRPSDCGLRGASEYGGHTRTLEALRRRGWATWPAGKSHQITKKGREALKQ